MLIQVDEQLTHTDFSFVPLGVISARGKKRFTLRKFSWSWPQPKNYIKNTAIWNRRVSRSLNSLNENLEPKKSQRVSGCTKEHPEFQIMMRNLFQSYPVRHSSKVHVLILSKALILSLGCMLETPGELLKIKRPGLYHRLTNWTRNSRGHQVFWKLAWWLWPTVRVKDHRFKSLATQSEVLRPSNGITWKLKRNAELRFHSKRTKSKSIYIYICVYVYI